MNAAAEEDTPPLSEQLLAAGARLARRTRLAGLTAEAVCREAGVDPAGFPQHFHTLAEYHDALAGRLMEAQRDHITRVCDKMPPGLARLKLAIETHLELNRSQPTFRELIVALRARPAAAETVRRMLIGFRMMVELELRAVGWPRPQASAHLLATMVMEIAQSELEAGKAVPALRETLFRYLDRGLSLK